MYVTSHRVKLRIVRHVRQAFYLTRLEKRFPRVRDTRKKASASDVQKHSKLSKY